MLCPFLLLTPRRPPFTRGERIKSLKSTTQALLDSWEVLPFSDPSCCREPQALGNVPISRDKYPSLKLKLWFVGNWPGKPQCKAEIMAAVKSSQHIQVKRRWCFPSNFHLSYLLFQCQNPMPFGFFAFFTGYFSKAIKTDFIYPWSMLPWNASVYIVLIKV